MLRGKRKLKRVQGIKRVDSLGLTPDIQLQSSRDNDAIGQFRHACKYGHYYFSTMSQYFLTIFQ